MQKLKELVTMSLYGVMNIKIFITITRKISRACFSVYCKHGSLTAVYFFSFKSFFSFFIYLALLGFAWKS